MRIGVDLDDVLNNFIEEFLDFYNQRNGTNIRKEEIIDYNFWSIFKISREKAIEEVHAFYETTRFQEMLPRDGAITGINYLERDNKLIIVTGRPVYEKNRTDNWLDMYFPGRFSESYFTSNFSKNGVPPGRKVEVCLREDVSLLLEDSLTTAIDCASSGITVLLFNQPWNQNGFLPRNVIRVKDWEEALATVKRT